MQYISSARQKLTMKIGTHSGHFHADEALAVWMLKTLPEFSSAEVVRSRDPAVLDQCDIVVDVGGKYEAPKWYDHHQREFTTTFDAEHTTTKLSSAGLVYKHYGKQVVTQLLSKQLAAAQPDSVKKRKLDVAEIADAVYPEAYNTFIEPVDALDNGVNAYKEKPAYKLQSMTLQSLVGNLSPLPVEDNSDAAVDAQFHKASELMGLAFEAEIRSLGLGWYPSREAVRQAYEQRFQYDSKGRIMVLAEPAFWKEFLEQFEKENKESGEVLYVLYPTPDSTRVQAVAKEPGSFESRKALPAPWRGVRDAALSEVTGVDGGVFVHASGFIGGNKTFDGALAMAKKAADF